MYVACSVVIADHQIVYQLNKCFSGDKENKLKSVLDEWQKIKRCKRSKIWVSDTLMADLNLPFFNYTPKFPGLVQAFFLGEGLPAFILTVYNKAKSTDQDAQSTDPSTSCQSPKHEEQKAEIHKVTVSAIKLLRWCLLDFCHCKFVILPLTLDIESLSVDSLTEELKQRKCQFRRYYDGDLCLKVGTYKTLVSAAIALFGSSFLPYLLETPLHEVRPFLLQSVSVLVHAEYCSCIPALSMLYKLFLCVGFTYGVNAGCCSCIQVLAMLYKILYVQRSQHNSTCTLCIICLY